MEIEWRDGFGAWTGAEEAEIADGAPGTFADESAVIGASGPIVAPADLDEDLGRQWLEWRDGLGDWASS